jgi:hypothetical protein
LYKQEGRIVLNSDLVKSICAIFLHDGQPVTPDHAAKLLGWTLDEMDKAIKWGDIELDPTTEDARISRAELIEKATHQWPFSVIQEALGLNAVNVFPPGLLVRPLIVPVHEYADAMLEYFAKKGRESKETVLGRILDDYAAQHLTELVANVPVFDDAASFMGEAKHTAAADPVSVHVARAVRVGGRSARASTLISPPASAAMAPVAAPAPAVRSGARSSLGCDRPAQVHASAAVSSVVRDHGGASLPVAPSVPALAGPPHALVPYVPESPAKRRRRLGARRASGEPLHKSPEPARRNRPDGIREATLSYFELGYQRFVPFLRLRGHWLASFGFKTRTRIYIEASQGCLVITVQDPANAKKAAESPAEQPGTVAEVVGARVGRRRRASAAAAAVAAQRVVRRA